MVALISGLIVRCWTFSSIRIPTSPLRWIIPKIGGFLRGERAASAFPLESSAPAAPPFTTLSGFPLCPATM